ncbi:MAG TPA: cytochrome c biogenesis protein CcdA [Acidimicrobiales bacterium]|nr:cytochrome c biogenesis protein CcdA [Acidimicrobiales bacterium]
MEALTLPLLAVVAGLVSFSSPCCLPLLPGYLSYISALPVTELGKAAARHTMLRASLLFVAGFTTVFTLLGVTSGLLGGILLQHLSTIVRVAGVGIVVFGLVTAGLIRVPWLYRERRLDLARVPRGPGWAYPFGIAFAAGWTPCIGPSLATILATAAATKTAWWGGTLLLFYSAGLGIPFVALALGYGRARRSVAFLKRHGRAVERVGGLLLVGTGVLFITGQWQSLFIPLQRSFAQLGWPPI